MKLLNLTKPIFHTLTLTRVFFYTMVAISVASANDEAVVIQDKTPANTATMTNTSTHTATTTSSQSAGTKQQTKLLTKLLTNTQQNLNMASDPATVQLRNKQQLLSIQNILEDEILKKKYTELRSRLQKLSWEKQELEQKLSIALLKQEMAGNEANSQHVNRLKELQQENDVLVQQLSIAKTKYELDNHETTTQNTEALTKLTSEKNLLKEELELEVLKRKNTQRELTLAHEERLTDLKRQREVLTEERTLADLQREKTLRTAKIEFEEKLTLVSREAVLANETAEKLENQLAAKRTEWRLKTVKLESEIEKIEIEKKRKAYIDATPVYLENPMEDDGTLVISDRRIPLNGVIRRGTADYITSRINYYNNMNEALPIFIVINDSPGGSVMEGYRILKAMEGSKAPIYVVVKSYAASMAAAITALAQKSYAYPNAVFLHHQISATIFANLNLTQQKELHENSTRWWKRLAKPIADKMGISTEEFIEKMYANSSRGDWSEFATEAQKLKWVDTVVDQIRETSLLKDPNTEENKFIIKLESSEDEKGRPVMYLPRLSPRDYYYMYNPDNYYQIR